jgi:hypothetical protein
LRFQAGRQVSKRASMHACRHLPSREAGGHRIRVPTVEARLEVTPFRVLVS